MSIQQMEKYSIDIFAFAETNLAWTPQNKYTLRTIGRQYFGQMKVETSSSNKLTLNKFILYGAQVGPCSLPPQLAVEGVVGMGSLARGNLEVGASVVHIWDLALSGAEAAAGAGI